ncbi:MAG: hypothetical protein ACLQUY_16165 [Ktedonobacterales bacterium]
MSSGHTNRGRNNNAGGNKSPRSRHASARQRNSQGQPVGQHRAQIAPLPAPIHINEISAMVEQDGFTYDDRLDQQAASLTGPIDQPEVDQKVGADPVSETPPSAQLPLERGSAVNSIRAPFAPGQNHAHPANHLRGSLPLPASGTTRQATDDSSDMWRPRLESASGSGSDPSHSSYRGDSSVAWSRQEQAGYESAALTEDRDVRGDIGPLIDSLHELFERDRGVASQGDATRCGICYLHFNLAELHYREEEGFYICTSCTRALAHTRIVMVRRQQHL